MASLVDDKMLADSLVLTGPKSLVSPFKEVA